MSAYVIVEFTVKGPDVQREKYGPNAGRTAKEHGGEVLAKWIPAGLPQSERRGGGKCPVGGIVDGTGGPFVFLGRVGLGYCERTVLTYGSQKPAILTST